LDDDDKPQSHTISFNELMIDNLGPGLDELI